jgi:hypothetical protein
MYVGWVAPDGAKAVGEHFWLQTGSPYGATSYLLANSELVKWFWWEKILGCRQITHNEA